MKINRYFPPCSNCLSHLLILECSYKSYLPLWPHLSLKFFSSSMAAPLVIRSTLCPRLCLTLASSKASRSHSHLLALSVWSYPGQASFPKLLFGLPDGFLKAPVVAKLSTKPLLLADPSAPTHPVLTKLRALNLWPFPAGAFQSNSCRLIVPARLTCVLLLSSLFISDDVLGSFLALSSCFFSACTNVTSALTFMRCCLHWMRGPLCRLSSPQDNVDKPSVCMGWAEQSRPWEHWWYSGEAI